VKTFDMLPKFLKKLLINKLFLYIYIYINLKQFDSANDAERKSKQ